MLVRSLVWRISMIAFACDERGYHLARIFLCQDLHLHMTENRSRLKHRPIPESRFYQAKQDDRGCIFYMSVCLQIYSRNFAHSCPSVRATQHPLTPETLLKKHLCMSRNRMCESKDSPMLKSSATVTVHVCIYDAHKKT